MSHAIEQKAAKLGDDARIAEMVRAKRCEELSELLKRIASRAHAGLANADNLDRLAEAVDDIRADADRANKVLIRAFGDI